MVAVTGQGGISMEKISQALDEKDLPKRFEDFRDFHAGQTILVCGCGRSLQLVSEPERFITIGVNDVGRMFHPDYLVVLNTQAQFRGDRFDYVKSSRARAFFTHLKLPIDHPCVVPFRLGQRGGTEPTAGTLPHTRNSPYLATLLAHYMGARRIGLIGVDFTPDHFWGSTGRHSLDREVRQINREYRRLRQVLAGEGVELVNLSPVSRVTELPYLAFGEFAADAKSDRSLKLVSYSATPLVGVPKILSDCINARTTAYSVAVQGSERYASGLTFGGDMLWRSDPQGVETKLRQADVIIAHNGKINPQHRRLLSEKPVLTAAHNMMWNVDCRFVQAGQPGVVVAQFPSCDPAFADWAPVPNPIPLWDDRFQPARKAEKITILYTPADRHGVFPTGDRQFMHSKGYSETVRILRRLAARHDIDLVLRGAEPLPHDRLLEKKRAAHIVIDECVTGGYHRNSLEGLAAGCVVVNGLGQHSPIADMLRRSTHENAPLPFETATLDILETVLEELISRGPDDLQKAGTVNRQWMETYWRFDDQWRRFWVPAIDRALENRPQRSRRVVRRFKGWIAEASPPSGVGAQPAAVLPKPSGAEVTVVIPFSEPLEARGGTARAPLLEAVLERLRHHAEASPIILAEIGAESRTEALCTARAVRHLFIPADSGPFHKTLVLNRGAALATTSHVLFLDADLLISADLVTEALVEAETRDLDCLLPWRWIDFLSESDSAAVLAGERKPEYCRPLARFTSHGSTNRAGALLVRRRFLDLYGGMIEEFRGWGCEDNAFFTKVELLGRAGVTRLRHPHAYHLFHRNSALDRTAAAAANPHHTANAQLLARIRTFRTASGFLAAFPTPSETAVQITKLRGQ